jgi:methionine aminopeptidase
MKEKNISNDDIIGAICLKYGSVEGYADYLKTSRQNIYNKISRKSKKFFVQLVKDGVFEKNEIHKQSERTKPEEEVEELRMTNKILLEKIIQLKEENERLRVQSEKDIVVDARQFVDKKK